MIKGMYVWLYENIINHEKFLLLLSILLIVIYLLPLFLWGELTYVQIYDNLDIAVPLTKVLAHSGMIFASSETIIPNVMGGLPRLTYGSEFNGYLWLHYFFSPFQAFTINEILMHTVAFWSMIVLLKHYFVPKWHPYRLAIIYIVSLMFALLPFYTGAGLSVPTVPLALYAFLNIRNGDSRWSNWFILALIPFYSSLVLVYFFVLLVISGLWVIDTFREREFNWRLFGALAWISLFFVIVEYRMIYAMFIDPIFVSHRSEFAILQNNTLFETYRLAHGVFLNGTVDMDTRASVIVIPFVLLVLSIMAYKKPITKYWAFSIIIVFLGLILSRDIMELLLGNKWAMPILMAALVWMWFCRREHRLLYLFILLQILFVCWYAFWFYRGTGELGKYIHILREFNFARVALLQPILWSIITAIAMVYISSKFRRMALILFMGIIGYQSVMAFEVREFSRPDSPNTWHTYYAPELFDQIKKYLGKDPSTYRVGCIAFEPAIAIYNGLYTIDGYVTSYPLTYKRKFEKIIRKPILKDKENAKLFQGWGSKCYLFDGGESMLYFRRNATIKKLDLDMDAYAKIGGTYLLSSHRIEPMATVMKNLTFMHEFHDPHTFWVMYLYRVNVADHS